jgi:uncharacterized protein YdbL (DUF1318 family)
MKKLFLIKAVAIFFLGWMTTTSVSVYASSVQDRMQDRLPEIVSLKTRGLAIENKQGFLDYKGENSRESELIKDENNDRLMIYEQIAKKLNTTVKIVGERRALQVMDKDHVPVTDSTGVIQAGKLAEIYDSLNGANFKLKKKNGTVDERVNDIEELAKDWVFYRRKIIEANVSGNTEKLRKYQLSFQQINQWLNAYDNEDVSYMIDKFD